jgi:hypothetical protein
MTSKPTSPSVLKILSCIHCIDNWINDVLHTFDGTTSSLLGLLRHLFAVKVFVIEWVKQLQMCVLFVSFLITWYFEALLIQKKRLHIIPFLARHAMGLTRFSWVTIKYNEIWLSFSQHSSNLDWFSMQYKHWFLSFFYAHNISVGHD